ncbi:MAG: arylsulfatase [Phycisphaerae bacterium]|jgi:arylsulfatase/arylsulfatase A
MQTSWRWLAVVVLAMALTRPEAAVAAPKTKRPNVILIVTDDQGIGDFSLAGNPVLKTPSLDALATGGMRMTRFYVCPVCTPTRAALMTGRYNYRTRAIDTYLGRAMMEPSEVTLAEALRDAGYATGIFGKWHLGDNYPMRAMDQGFEESLVIRGGGIGQPSDPPGGEGKYTDPVLFHNGRAEPRKGYCTDVFFEAAGEWMSKAVRQERNFFAYIPTNAPHSPLEDVPQDLYEQYRKLDYGPVLVPPVEGPAPPAQADMLARVFAMIANIDANVGRMMNRLKELGVLDDTVILFLNDNGPNSRRFVGPLRGMKAEVYEGGIRAAFFAHWPAGIRPRATSDVPAAHIDVMPTLLDACGVAPPSGVKLDGRSLMPVLTGTFTEWPERTLFVQSHRGDQPVRYHHCAVITARWKLVNPSGFGLEIYAGPPKFELYDLEKDPGERQDRSAEHPEIVARLREDYERWFADVGSTRPDNYAPPRIHVGTPHENPVVLTRQNWRLEVNGAVRPGNQGVWRLRVARAGTYQVRLRFPTAAAAGEALLRFGGYENRKPIRPGDAECIFADVSQPDGNADLKATLTIGGKTQGPWQVDVEGPP